MTTCTYSFTGADGKPTVITGKAAFKAYLLDGGLQHLLPAVGLAMPGVKVDAGDASAADGGMLFSKRTRPDPKKSVTAYKLFRVEKDRPGELFPLFVPVWGESGPQKFSNRDPRRHGEGLPIGEWYDAEVGETAPATKTGKPQVKSKLGGLAFRPGWHAGDLPIATHIGAMSDPDLKAPDLRAPNQVWAEVEMPDDVDWQTEANKRGVNKKGKLIAREAHITDQIPEDGFYRYKTNSNMTGNWLIGGSMKVTRILSDEEVKQINDAAGTADLPRAEPFDYEGYGFRKPMAGPRKIQRSERIGEKLHQMILSDFDKAVSEYSALPDTKGGKLLDTDQARELSPEYRADRTRAPEVHEAASDFTQRAFEKRMAEAKPGGLVLFMAGGGGAGKSSAENLLAPVFDAANTIMDGTLSSYDKAKRNIQLALNADQAVMIAYVYREPVEALRNGVLTRAMKRGRTVTLDALVKGHAGSSEVVRKLQAEFGDNPLFEIKAIDNSRGPDNYVEASLDEIPVVEREGLKEKFQNATDEEFKAGRISDAVYRSTTGGLDTRAGRSPAQAQEGQPRNERQAQGTREPGGPQYSVRTDTAKFKRWFGDSQVVNNDGTPRVMYHGTAATGVREFSGNRGSAGHFAFEPELANDYADAGYADAQDNGLDEEYGDGAVVYPVYLSAQNIFDARKPEHRQAIGMKYRDGDSFGYMELERAVPAMKRAGFDAYYDIEYAPSLTFADEVYAQGIAVFRPEQIKSASGNNGEFNPENPSILASQRVGRETEGWITSRDAVGRLRFGAGAKAYRAVADIANVLLEKTPVIGSLKPASPELSRYMRQMKAEVANARDLTVDVAKNLKEIPEDERQMISDVIEGEMAAGIVPPKRVLELAASMQSLMTEQSEELVRLKMLTPEAAGRWDGKYLPRFYEQSLKSEAKGWVKAAKNLLGRQRTMQGIGGSSLKSRGLFETIPVEDLNDWIAEGWEVRDANFDPAKDDVIGVWRDYTKDERESMGEIRDAMFRFTMGYMKSQRDIALGRLYERLATDVASRTEKPGFVQVPSSNVEDTTAKRYGALAGKWVPQEVLDHLTANDGAMNSDLLKLYRNGLSKWKEGKTVLNPVAHANNVISNLTMAHFAGVSYWDGLKYFGALKDLVTGNAMVKEAKEAGLFGGTFTQDDLVNMLPDELKELAGKTESSLAKVGNLAWNIASLGLRKPLAKAYEAEDLYFRYLIYRDARQRGLDVEDAVDYAQKFIFTYDDLPKGARAVRDAPIGVPFFSWSFKAIPVLAQTAAEYPWRFAAPAAVVMTANAMAYAIAAGASAGDGDDEWWKLAQRYITDPEFRARAQGLEKEERKNLPEWQKGKSIFGTDKAIRLGMDDLTGLPLFLDISRIFPGGDMGDFNNNTGGWPLPAWLTPNSPVFSALTAYVNNLDAFRNKEVVNKNLDTASEKIVKWNEWGYQQFAPAIAPFNYHFDRIMNALANATGKDIDLYFREYTGTDKMGQPVQAKYAAMQTVGVKVRPVDLEVSEGIANNDRKRQIAEINKQIKAVTRAEDRGFYTGKRADELRERLEIKRDNLKEGLTVTGKERE